MLHEVQVLINTPQRFKRNENKDPQAFLQKALHKILESQFLALVTSLFSASKKKRQYRLT
jgi:hypothetical protein